MGWKIFMGLVWDILLAMRSNDLEPILAGLVSPIKSLGRHKTRAGNRPHRHPLPHIYAHAHTHIHTCARAHTRTRTHTHTHTDMRARAHTHTHTLDNVNHRLTY